MGNEGTENHADPRRLPLRQHLLRAELVAGSDRNSGPRLQLFVLHETWRVWTSLPTGSLKISIEEPALVSKYAFGTGTARFDICGRCGVVPVVTSETDGRLYAVVNVNTFNDVPRSLLRPAPVSFEDEDLGSRLARRMRNWIADVRYLDAEDRAGKSGLPRTARTG